MNENWQSDLTLEQSIAKLFNNECMADVRFKIKHPKSVNLRTSSSSTLPKDTIIYAHSQILAARSYKFYQRFKKESGGGMKKITIFDFDGDVIYNFIQFLYTDATTIDKNNVWDLIELAINYSVTNLEQQCTNCILDNISIDELCDLFERSMRYNMQTLYSNSLNLIQLNLREIFKEESFLKIDENVLTLILNSDIVKVGSETEMLEAALAWSKYKNDDDDNNNTKMQKSNRSRETIFYDELLTLIRFPAMGIKELAQCMINYPHLLKNHEVAEIIALRRDNLPEDQKPLYSAKKRKFLDMDYEIMETCYLSIGSMDGQIYDELPAYNTKFRVNKFIVISALYVSGTYYNNPCDIYILNDNNDIEANIENIHFTDWGGEVIFPEPVRITPEYDYTIAVKYSKEDGKYLGHSSITEFPHVCVESDVQFTFSEISPLLYYIHFKII